MDDWLDAREDDVLDLGPRPTSRRFVVIAVCALLAVVAGIVVQHHGSGHRAPRAEPSPSPTPSPVQVAATTLPSSGVYLGGSTLVTLDGRTLRAVDLRSGGRASLASVPQVGPAGRIELVGDPASSTLWTVAINAVPTRLSEYRLPDLHLLRRVTWPRVAQSATALSGHVYLSTSLGVADLAPGAAAPLPIAGLYGAVGPVVADPSRHRIIAVDLGYPTDVWSYTPGHAPAEARSPLPLANGTVGVVGDRIWIGGNGTDQPVLWRLEPTSFQPATRARLPVGLGANAVVVGAGANVVWMRSSLDDGRLYCVDADRGSVLQSWPVRGVVTSTDGAAFVQTATGVQPLALGSCRG